MLEKRKNTFRENQFRRQKQFARGKNCYKAGKNSHREERHTFRQAKAISQRQ